MTDPTPDSPYVEERNEFLHKTIRDGYVVPEEDEEEGELVMDYSLDDQAYLIIGDFFDDGRYDDDPSPYDGTYSEE